ncbi:MAG: pyridoxal phosphate-dependent aminotransferase [Myxococcota bacterium]|nr:pyridoxal phosphate-dependent aminotransferase [Myxococcota bacterium]
MKFSRRITPIAPSATLAITNGAKQLRAEGKDVVGFGAGEPDFDTPSFIVDAMIAAAREGQTRYGAVAGMPDLRQAVAEMFTGLYDVPFSSQQTLVSVGGKQALYNLFQVLVDPGDEVIIPTPYWVSYSAQVQLAEGAPVLVPSPADNGFQIDVDAIEAAVTDRTVGLVLNSPNNPTGAVQSPEVLRALGDLAERHDLWVITDDIYSELRYDGGAYASILRERPDLRDRIIVVHGASKTYAMTGWRIGFVGAQEALVKKLSTLAGQSTSNPTAFAQYGALAAVQSDGSFLTEWRSAYDARRRRIVDLLNDIDGISCHLPGGAFYVFPDVRGLLGTRLGSTPIDSSMALCQALLEHALVACVPGEPFGAPGFMRLSYACSMEDIEKGLGRIAELASRLER